jgi:hypothetical protein
MTTVLSLLSALLVEAAPFAGAALSVAPEGARSAGAIRCLTLESRTTYIPVSSQDDPPDFGTVLGQWELEMSGSYAGAGITWVRDSGKFYLMDQGYAGTIRVWNLDPADPERTIRAVPWTFANLGAARADIPWGIAWDSDSGCFWISQMADGDIYGGCYLLRHVWNDSAWVWGGAPGDSWLVGTGSNRGGLDCLWIAGMEMARLKDLFYAAPVHSSPSELNHVVMFDPYTKTNHGRVAHGDQTCEHGCTVIPWDSSYILTCGWNSGSFRKRDSTGYLLEQASASNSPADWSLHVPQVINNQDTVCAYCINSNSSNCLQRVSTGLLWGQLRSVLERTVRPCRMLAPVGFVDSGTAVIPSLILRNYAEGTAENVSVHFLIDNQADLVVYHDSLVVTLAPKSMDTVEFETWVAVGSDTMGMAAWTYWPGDSTRQDDTISQRFFVRVIDVGITGVESPIPGDTIDPDTVYPGCVLWNHGNVTTTVPMVFNIGPYWDTVWVHNLIAGGSRPAAAERPWAASAGRWQCLMEAEVIGDLHPDNNDTGFVFYVRGEIDHDVEVSSIDAPVVLVDTLPFVPQATVRNNSSSTEQFCTLFWIEDTSTETRVYFDTIPVWLPGGQRIALAFRPCTLKVEGQYVASCSAHLVTDQDWLNNALHQGFQVGSGVGAKEQPKQRLAAEIPEPTIVRGILPLPAAGMANDQGPMALLDITGRRVMDLKPGANDVRHLAPGIYYLRLVTGGDAVCRKVVKLK